MVRQCAEINLKKQIKRQKELRRKTKEHYRNMQEGKTETKKWMANGSKKVWKRIGVTRTLILSLYLALFTNPFFWMGTGALEPGQLGWDLGRGAGNSKAGGSCAWGRSWSSFSTRREVWEGQDGSGRPSSSFLLSPLTMSDPSNNLWIQSQLCRKKEEVGKERQKNFSVAKPHTTLEDLILTPESSCHNPVLHLSSVVLVRGNQTLCWCSSMLPISLLPSCFMLET